MNDQVGAAVCFFLEFCEDETQAIAHGYAPLNYTGLPIESAYGDPAESAEHAENCG